MTRRVSGMRGVSARQTMHSQNSAYSRASSGRARMSASHLRNCAMLHGPRVWPCRTRSRSQSCSDKGARAVQPCDVIANDNLLSSTERNENSHLILKKFAIHSKTARASVIQPHTRLINQLQTRVFSTYV